MAYVRVSISANEMKAEVEKAINQKVPAVLKNPDLRNDLVTAYATTVTKYVPRSDRDVSHHLNEWYISDGRVMWSRYNSKGEEIAESIYNGSRAKVWNISPTVENHSPQAYWDNAVRPGQPDWPVYIEKATKIIKEYLDGDSK